MKYIKNLTKYAIHHNNILINDLLINKYNKRNLKDL